MEREIPFTFLYFVGNLGLRSVTNYAVYIADNCVDLPYPQPVTLRRAFTSYLDISSPPSQELLGLLAQCASNNKEQSKIEQLATVIKHCLCITYG